jgi:hypothetical protein
VVVAAVLACLVLAQMELTQVGRVLLAAAAVRVAQMDKLA